MEVTGNVDEGFIKCFTGTSDAVVFFTTEYIDETHYLSPEEKNAKTNGMIDAAVSSLAAVFLNSGIGIDSEGDYDTELAGKQITNIVNSNVNAAKSRGARTSSNKYRNTGNNGYQVKEYEDGIYEGYLTNGKRNGLGLFIYNSGLTYSGHWKNDVPSGRGMKRAEASYSSARRQSGMYNNGKLTGNVAVLEEGGDLYIGGFDSDYRYSGNGKMVYKNGNVYIGEMQKGYCQGKGTMFFNDGTKHVGSFYLGVIIGEGVRYYTDGSRLEGVWSQDGIYGKAKYYFADGGIYDGTFSSKYKFDGHGTRTWPNGDVYTGNFKNGAMSGKGKLTTKDGDSYEGDFLNGQYHGIGVVRFADGRIYQGEVNNGQMTGKGIYSCPDGVIEGNFLNGEAHGWAVFKDDRIIYCGEFDNGKQKGSGILYDKASHEYIRGMWNDEGQLLCSTDRGTCTIEELEGEGEGHLDYSNGDVYDGYIKYITPEGNGVYTYANGDKIEGTFVHGICEGKATITYVNGEKYIGETKNNKMNGNGTYLWPNGNSYIGKYYMGYQLGVGTMLYSNNRYESGSWKDGVLVKKEDEGKWKYENGKIVYKSKRR